jgi:ligand-binding sensor domain-containing protein
LNIVPLPKANDSDFETIYRDHDGSFWIGSTLLFHMSNGELTPSVLPGLAGVHVRNVFRDRNGVLWVGTDGDGVFRIQGSDARHFTTSDGLSNNFVRAITQDHDGSIWINTDEGLNHVLESGKKTRIVMYQMHDGLAYFSTRDLLEDRNGDLWVGTDRGVDL